MSLNAFSGVQNLAPRAVPLQPVPVRFAQRAQIPEHNASKRGENFADVVARQLPGMAAAGAVAAPVAKRAGKAARPFGKRVVDDDYVGPVELDQDEFEAPTRTTFARRQAASPGSSVGGTNNWVNGDLGYVMARYTNGTTIPVVIGNTVYAVHGSEDACGSDEKNPGQCYPLPQLQARIQTVDGKPTASTGTFIALKDDLSAYSDNAFIGVGPSQNAGVPYWLEPEASPAYVWTIDQSTGAITAVHPSAGALKFGINENRVPYPGSSYSGNGDVDAWPASQQLGPDHAAATLYLSKTASA